MDRVAFHGRGLHSGELCSVAFDRDFGPVRLRMGKRSVELSELSVLRTDHGVQLGLAGEPAAGSTTPATELPTLGGEVIFRLDLVEHLMAALAGLGIYSDLEIRASGPELPLLDGGALEYSLALLALELPQEPPRTRICRRGELQVGSARYTFEPADTTQISVTVDFPGVGEQRASWNGTRAHFLEAIAPARTFGYRSDHQALLAAGRAQAVNPRSVMVLNARGEVEPPGAPMAEAELARHKLLDLMGDLFLGGGPLLGQLSADQPGHTNNQRVLQAARAAQLIEAI